MQLVVSNSDLRIDKYLSLNTTNSRSLITKMFKDNLVLVNGVSVKPSYKVKENDIIVIPEDYVIKNTITGSNIKIDIVYEDNDIIVINKQSGLTVHPGSGNYDHTLVNALINHTKLSDGSNELRPGIVHRIDKDTSGLLLVAKNNKAHEILADDFKNKRVHREYIALICGVFPHASATIDAPIGRDPKNRKAMTVIATNSKKAVTHLTVLKRYEDYTLVSLVLDTGRTHQIRVHMKYIGYPIYNDPVYNTKKASEFGQFLHSHTMDFIHPITKEPMHFAAPLPEDFQKFIDTLVEKA